MLAATTETEAEVKEKLRELMLFAARPTSETRNARRECSIRSEESAVPSDAVLLERKLQISQIAEERLTRRRSGKLQSPVVVASGADAVRTVDRDPH